MLRMTRNILVCSEKIHRFGTNDEGKLKCSQLTQLHGVKMAVTVMSSCVCVFVCILGFPCVQPRMAVCLLPYFNCSAVS